MNEFEHIYILLSLNAVIFIRFQGAGSSVEVCVNYMGLNYYAKKSLMKRKNETDKDRATKRVKAVDIYFTDSEDESQGAGDMKSDVNIVLPSDEEFPNLCYKGDRSRTTQSHSLVKLQQIYKSDIGLIRRTPKANACRRKWSKEEEDEIKSMVDLKNMKEQPKAILSKNMLKKSKEQDGAIQHRSQSALKNKLIRNWVAHHKGESANKQKN
jgi:hypothetical protein